ncbi:hypothetical protein MCHUDSM44219_03516 [Mycolicibacterium chubuense]|uniref:Uncharacterized protein n=1 Tax=Mycolicibacterium chubuense TaxID=1800 RepID=A0A0J6VXJ7_MYCCU|nr:hypothetical protein MCHUDSM44219_03516 [Mycolicibacterium chubuense]
MLAAMRTAAARWAGSAAVSMPSASRAAVAQSPVKARASASCALGAELPASAAARYSRAARAGWEVLRPASSVSAAASRSSCRPCSASRNAKSAVSVEDSS